MKIGILGSSGLIGYNLYNFLCQKNAEVLGTYFSRERPGLKKFDLNSADFSFFDTCQCVVIAGAISDIDACLLDKEKAYQLNVVRTNAFISYLAGKKIWPVFLSSDQVFRGDKGNYTEDDLAAPLNNYGRFKLEVEEFIRNNLKDWLVLRLSKTYSRNPGEESLYADIFLKLKRGEKIKAAYNQVYNPTDVGIVCEVIYRALHQGLEGLYHLAEPRVMSRYDFACLIAQEHNFDQGLIERVDLSAFNFREQRALNSSLNVSKITRALALDDLFSQNSHAGKFIN
jgi:dTDP-4-dehydrorhamnose reductase